MTEFLLHLLGTHIRKSYVKSVINLKHNAKFDYAIQLCQHSNCLFGNVTVPKSTDLIKH